MIETYDIGARILLDDAITGQLDAVKEQFDSIYSVIKRINSSLGKIPESIEGATGSVGELSAAFDRATDAADRLRSATDGIGGGIGGGGGGANDPNSPHQPNDRHSGVMDALGAAFMVYAGAGIVSGAVNGIVGPAFDLQDQIVNLENNGATPAQAGAVVNAAFAISKQNPGMTVGQVFSTIQNLYSVDHNMNDVLALAPRLARDAYVLQHAQGGDGETGDEMYSILRAAEDSGKLNDRNPDGSINLQKAAALFDTYTKIIVNSNGNATGEGALQLIAQAGPGATMLGDHALALAAIQSQSLQPGQVGQGLRAMDQQLSGKMSQAVAERWHEAGILPDYMFGPDGKPLKKYRYGIGQVMLPAGTIPDDAFIDPEEWLTDHLFKRYLNPDGTVKKGDEGALQTAINQDFGQVVAARLMGNYLFNHQVQDLRLQNIANQPSLDNIHAADAGTASSQAAGMASGFNAFLIELANPLLPSAAAGLHIMTEAWAELGKQAHDHPQESLHALVEGGIDAALGGGWLGGKLLSKVPIVGGFAEGFAGLIARLLPPVLVGELVSADLYGLERKNGIPAPWTDQGQQDNTAAIKGLINILDRLFNGSKPLPVAIHSVQRPVPVAVQATPYGTSMPTGPTTHLPAQSLPMPGQTGH